MRELSGAFQAALLEDVIEPVFLWRGDFSGIPLRLWSGLGPIDFAGEEYTGSGYLHGISTVTDTEEIQASGLTIELSGVPTDVLSLVLNAEQGGEGLIYLGLLDGAGALVSDPFLLFRGFLDTLSINEQGSAASVSLQYEHELIKLQIARGERYTHERQKALFPDDRGFEYLPQLQTWTGYWGAPESNWLRRSF